MFSENRSVERCTCLHDYSRNVVYMLSTKLSVYMCACIYIFFVHGWFLSVLYMFKFILTLLVLCNVLSYIELFDYTRYIKLMWTHVHNV